jgi:hypothetical protein
MKLRILERYPRMTILHHVDGDGQLWGTFHRHVCVRKDGSWQRVAQFPFHAPRDYFDFSRPTARLFRADKCNVYRNRLGAVLGIRAGQVYRISVGVVPQPQPLFTIQGDCVLHGSIGEDAAGNVYLGEYFMNPERGAVRIWRVAAALDAWEIAYEFPAGSIRHVHGVYRDPYDEEGLWVAVGDFRGECFILRTKDAFKTLERYGDGEQIWRAVKLFFTEDHVCWLTDSNLELNHACRMQRRTGKLEIGMDIANSGWYGTTTREGLHVAFTTVEKGPGITSRFSEILVSRDAFHWESIYAFKKDWYRPVQLFKYGVVNCPSGLMSQHDLYISGEGLVGLDGSSMRIDIMEGKGDRGWD